MLIAHLSESMELDEPAFVHAVALGMRSKAAVAGVHMGEPPGAMPHATDLLQRWGQDTPHFRHRWTLCGPSEDPAEALLAALSTLRPTLVVAGTRARSGVGRLLAGSVAESVARNLSVPTLILPAGSPGFVQLQDGAIDLATLLLPVGSAADAQLAVDVASAFSGLAAAQPGQLVLLHLVDGTPAPTPVIPARFASVRRIGRGSFESAVEACANEVDASLIVMPTHGHDGLADVLFASHVERVLHTTSRPVLWVPAGASAWPEA